MKLTIRNNVWETNSSSMHSIAVLNNTGQYTHDEMLDDLYIHNGKWDIWSDDDLSFGRYPFKILTSFKDKLCYAIASFAGSYTPFKEGSEFIDEVLMPIISKYVPECFDIDFPKRYEQAYKDQEGNDLDPDDIHYHKFSDTLYDEGYEKDGVWYHAIIDNEHEWTLPYFGNIDHQSSGLLQSFLKQEGISLEDFLVNRQYIIIIDGDEYYDWDKYKEIGIINVAGIDHEYPPATNYGQVPMDSYEYYLNYSEEQKNEKDN